MRRIIGYSLLILIAMGTNSWARVWHVKSDGTGSAVNIQAGIDSASAGDTVLVTPGIYRGDGNRDIDFKGKPILVIGQCRFDNTTTDSSVIDCEGTQEAPHRGFYFHSGETASSVLDGLVVANGFAYVEGGYGTAADVGGGILCDSLSSPLIQYNTIRDCFAFVGGSGIFCESSSPTIRSNMIYADGRRSLEGDLANALAEARLDSPYSGSGGAIGCHLSSAVITSNKILNNASPWGIVPGGGIKCISCPSMTISNNDINGNIGGWGEGGGMYLESSTAKIDGNNILGNDAYPDMGGAIYARNCELTISNNKIGYNSAYVWGTGAVYCRSCTITMYGNEIYNNYKGVMTFDSCEVNMDSNDIHDNFAFPVVGFHASRGSHIRNNTMSSNTCVIQHQVLVYNGVSATIIEGNKFIDNNGSAISCESSSPEIRGNLIIRNGSSYFGGGGVYCGAASPRISNNTIVGNVGDKGAGIYIDSLSSPVLIGNIVANDSVPPMGGGQGGGIYSESSTVTLSCNDVYNNQGGNYIGISDQTGLNGNISVHPLFCDAARDDFMLAANSPCLASQEPGGCGLMGAFDRGCGPIATLLQDFRAELAGSGILVRWKLSEASNRMDFFVLRAEAKSAEFADVPNPGIERDGLSFVFRDTDCKPGTDYRYRVGVSDEAGRRVLFETGAITTPAAKLALYQNYPNPFNPSTSISYYLPSKARVAVEIYDASGALVKRLMGEEQESGAHTIAWSGLDDRGGQVASGVYFYRLRAGKEAISRKMILLR